MSSARLFAFAPVAVVVGLIAVMTFSSSPAAKSGIQMHGPSDGPLFLRHPHLYQIERDLASGRLSLADAVEIVMPLVQSDQRLCEATEFRGGGLRRGVALMLREWVDKIAEADSEAVSDATLERLHEDLAGMVESHGNRSQPN